MTLHLKHLLALGAGLATLAVANLTWARTILCESRDRETEYCRADTRDGVRLTTQYSKAGCYQDRTWGYDRRGVWVSNGCRARFDLGDDRSDQLSSRDSNAAAALAIGLIGAAAIASSQHDDDRDDDHVYQPQEHYRRWSPPRIITCESRENRQNYCRANLRHARVDIDRQLSRQPCRYGRNWGWDSHGIWVDDGCRARFSIDEY